MTYKQLHPHYTPVKTTEVVLYVSATLQESAYTKKKWGGTVNLQCVCQRIYFRSQQPHVTNWNNSQFLYTRMLLNV
jgi:hypothetical protein